MPRYTPAGLAYLSLRYALTIASNDGTPAGAWVMSGAGLLTAIRWWSSNRTCIRSVYGDEKYVSFTNTHTPGNECSNELFTPGKGRAFRGCGMDAVGHPRPRSGGSGLLDS